VDLSKEQVDKLFYELNRIGNATETIAANADDGFMPMDEGLRHHVRDRNLRKNQTKKPPAPLERLSP
jgi:hypothetical protein